MKIKTGTQAAAGVKMVRDHVMFVEPYTGVAVPGEAE